MANGKWQMADGKSQIAQRGECEQGELLTTDFTDFTDDRRRFFLLEFSRLIELTRRKMAESWGPLQGCIVAWLHGTSKHRQHRHPSSREISKPQAGISTVTRTLSAQRPRRHAE